MINELIARLRETASKGVSVWGDLQMEAAKEIEILTAEREAYAAAMDRMKSALEAAQAGGPVAELTASPPDYWETKEALKWLDQMIICAGGENGPSIKLRAAIMAMNAAWNGAGASAYARISELRAKMEAAKPGEDVKQIIYALERQIAALDIQAETLAKSLDYSAEFPAEDARHLRAAIARLTHPAPQVPEPWRKVLQELVAVNSDPAHLTPEIIDDKEAFNTFMKACAARTERAVSNAKALLATAPQVPLKTELADMRPLPRQQSHRK